MLNMYIHFYAYIYISQFTNKIEVLQKKKKEIISYNTNKKINKFMINNSLYQNHDE